MKATASLRAEGAASLLCREDNSRSVAAGAPALTTHTFTVFPEPWVEGYVIDVPGGDGHSTVHYCPHFDFVWSSVVASV